MKVNTQLFPNPTVNGAIHSYSIAQSTPVASSLDIHRQESEKWAVENGAPTVMFVNPLQVCSLLFTIFFFFLVSCPLMGYVCDRDGWVGG